MTETYQEARERNKTVDPMSVYPMATVALTYEDTGASHDPIFGYTCTKCGAHAATTFIRSTAEKMVERGLCFYCNYDVDLAEHVAGNWRGMAGRRFDIEYIEPSIWAGHRITTFDLWSGADMKPELREKFHDTALFLNGAEKVSLQGEIKTAWESSNRNGEPYPLPMTLPDGGPK